MKKTVKIGIMIFTILTVAFFPICSINDGSDNPPEEKTTKNYNNRAGQTVEAISKSLSDPSALDCNVDPILNIETFTQEYLDNYILGVDISSIIEVEKEARR